jgi:5-methyltetrahydropteroyltriglutamate--homocysteine methyltransferase
MSGPSADQVGSLLRPARLRDSREAYEAGRLDRAALVAIEDEAIIEALRAQRATGIGVLTDGEYRRGVYMLGLVDAVDGFTLGSGPTMPWRVDSGEVPPETANFTLGVVTGRLRRRHRVAGDEAAFLRAHAPGPVKVTLPSPAHFVRCYQPERSGAAYPTVGEFLADVTAILAAEAAALAAEGVGYIQVDAPTYGAWCDPTLLGGGRGDGAMLSAAIAADNAIVDAARSAGALTAVHICRGNASGAWISSGGYEPVAERVFSELRCDRLLLEYDTERAGGFEPLRLVPDGKTAVLGLVTTKSAAVESRDALLARLDNAARFIAVDRLALSPQCGFASNFRGNPLAADDQWRKLELVATVAREVWP